MPNNSQQRILHETRAEEVAEIISAKPHWLVRWGVFVVGILLAMVFVSARLIRYPNKVYANLLISTNDPPITVFATTAGSIEQVFVKEGDTVQAMQPLVLYASGSKYHDVVKFKQQLTAMLVANTPTAISSQNLQLGMLQQAALSVQAASATYFEYAKIAVTSARYTQLNSNLESCKLTQRQLGKLTQVNAKISAIAKQQFLADEQSLKLIELRAYALQRVTAALESIAAWERQFIIKAPCAAIVSNKGLPIAKQYVPEGTKFSFLAQVVTTPLKLTGQLPVQSYGEVRKGQRVQLYFTNYPNTKYGFVASKLTELATSPRDSAYYFSCALPNTLVTTTGFTIPLQHPTYGQVIIVTRDMSLWQRIFNRALLGN